MGRAGEYSDGHGKHNEWKLQDSVPHEFDLIIRFRNVSPATEGLGLLSTATDVRRGDLVAAVGTQPGFCAGTPIPKIKVAALKGGRVGHESSPCALRRFGLIKDGTT